MSHEFTFKIASILSQINQIKQYEITSFIHCSKINSLAQSFTNILDSIKNFNEKFKKDYNSKNIENLNILNDSIGHFLQLCIQCTRESSVQTILSKSTQQMFEDFLQIRQNVIKSLKLLGIEEFKFFELNSDQLLSQDQVDLKRIGSFIQQMTEKNDLSKRVDINEKILLRFNSIERKGVKMEKFDGSLIDLPSLPSNLNLILTHEQLHYDKEIGKGMSGKVFSGKINGDSQIVAIKILHQRQLNSSQMAYLRSEIFTLATLSHPSILKLLGYTPEPPFCLVTEYLSNGSLSDFLKKSPNNLNPTERTIIAIDIARGMSYMHEHNIIHRDLKSLNILLDENKRVRICDFGLVRIKSFQILTTQIGTPQWMAPEIMLAIPDYDSKVDVYSFGIVLWELLTNKMPFSELSPADVLKSVVVNDLRPIIPENTPIDLSNLINSCWEKDPKKRPSFQQINYLFNNSKYHYPGTNEKELWEKVGEKKKKKLQLVIQ